MYDANYNKTNGWKDHLNQPKVGGGTGRCSANLTTSHSDDKCKPQKKQAKNGGTWFSLL